MFFSSRHAHSRSPSLAAFRFPSFSSQSPGTSADARWRRARRRPGWRTLRRATAGGPPLTRERTGRIRGLRRTDPSRSRSCPWWGQVSVTQQMKAMGHFPHTHTQQETCTKNEVHANGSQAKGTRLTPRSHCGLQVKQKPLELRACLPFFFSFS